jgi:hypothetical protein
MYQQGPESFIEEDVPKVKVRLWSNAPDGIVSPLDRAILNEVCAQSAVPAVTVEESGETSLIVSLQPAVNPDPTAGGSIQSQLDTALTMIAKARARTPAVPKNPTPTLVVDQQTGIDPESVKRVVAEWWKGVKESRRFPSPAPGEPPPGVL